MVNYSQHFAAEDAMTIEDYIGELNTAQQQFEELAKKLDGAGAGAHQHIGAAQIRAAGLQYRQQMFMAEAVLGLNKEFARLDKTLNDLTKSVEDSAIHLTDALTQSIDQSVGITNKVQEFITALESQAAEMTAQIKELVLKNRDLVTENTRLRYVTLGLAIATFLAAVFTAWMAYSTQALADEAKLNMARDVGDKRFQELRQALEKEKSIYIDQLIQKDLELANLRKQNNLRKER